MAEEKLRIKLTGLWEREAKGIPFLSGAISPTLDLVIFKNGFKRSEREGRDPDWIAYLSARLAPRRSTGDGQAVGPVISSAPGEEKA